MYIYIYIYIVLCRLLRFIHLKLKLRGSILKWKSVLEERQVTLYNPFGKKDHTSIEME